MDQPIPAAAAAVLEVLYLEGMVAVTEQWPRLGPSTLVRLLQLLQRFNAAQPLLDAADQQQAQLDHLEQEVAGLLELELSRLSAAAP